MKIKIINDIKRLEKGYKVFKLHAGRHKKFLDVFQLKNEIFMELPKLPIGELALSSNGEFTALSKQLIQRSMAIANYHHSNGIHEYPPEDIGMYHPDNGLGATQNPVDSQTFSAIAYLYFNASPGDLVVVPGRSYTGAVLVGEIADTQIGSTSIVDWGDIPTRKVIWLNGAKTRHSFSLEFVKQLVHPRALHFLPASLSEEIYDYAYGNWTYGDLSSVSLDVFPRNRDDNEVSPQSLSALNLLIMYYGSVFDQLNEKREIKSFNDTLIDLLQSDSTEFAWEGSIHSPGKVTFRIKNSSKAAFILAMMALTAQAAENIDQDTPQHTQVEVVNKWNKVPDSCDIEIGEDIKSALLHMNVDIWIENCKAQKRLVDRQLEVGNTTTITIDAGDGNGN